MVVKAIATKAVLGFCLIAATALAGPSTIASIVNGASFASGAISPGEVITIFGSNIGPAVSAGLTLSSTNTVATTLNETSVTLNGMPAPLIFVSLNQINASVPYEVATKRSVAVVVTSGATVSEPFTVNVDATAPGLFSLSENGSGQGAILNQDGSVNGSANPAAAGSIIVIFVTGEGVTTPPAQTGSVTPATGMAFLQPVGHINVTIGGIDSFGQVLFAGEAPGLIAGVLQLNVVVPPGTPSGNQPVTLYVGGPNSPSITAAIQ